MLLHAKNAAIFAATGAIAGAVAREYARQGAQVWLSGRNADALAQLATVIREAGGQAQWQTVDAQDPAAVDAWLDQIAAQGSLDVVFNGIGSRPRDLGYPARSLEQSLADFNKPFVQIVSSTFLTSRSAARHMTRQGHGAIVTLSATLSGMTAPHMAGISAACGAVEALTRALAGEFGPAGVRVNCVRGSAMPETRTIQETFAGQMQLGGMQPGDAAPAMSLPPLGRMITLADTAGAAAYLASDAASGITGQVLTVCAGAFVD
ncbi:MAG: SDR family NAD(P)-dependent oxidoreductase [Candidatus Sericytochromatia bacterium]